MRTPSSIRTVRAQIELDADLETQKLILAVIGPEFAYHKGERSALAISPSNDGLELKAEATDLSSFKASLTSTLRLISVILEIQRTIQKELGG